MKLNMLLLTTLLFPCLSYAIDSTEAFSFYKRYFWKQDLCCGLYYQNYEYQAGINMNGNYTTVNCNYTDSQGKSYTGFLSSVTQENKNKGLSSGKCTSVVIVCKWIWRDRDELKGNSFTWPPNSNNRVYCYNAAQ